MQPDYFFAYLPGGICHGEEFRPIQWEQDHIRKGSPDRKLHLLESYELIRRDRTLKWISVFQHSKSYK